MALEVYNGFGPEANGSSLYLTNVNFSVTNSPAPPQGNYWLKGTRAAADTFDLQAVLPAANYAWFALRAFMWDGTIDEDDYISVIEFRMPNPTDWRRIIFMGQADGSGRVHLYRDSDGVASGIEGPTSFGENVPHSILVQYDETNIKVWVDGLLEITEAELTRLWDSKLEIPASSVGTPNRYWRGGVLCGSDNVADRPNTAVWVGGIYPDANGTDGEYSDDGDCSAAGTGNADYTHWDDYINGGTSDDGAEYNCAPGTVDWEQTSEASDLVLPVADIEAVIWRGLLNPGAGAKTITNWARLRYNANISDVSLPNITTAAWAGYAALFLTPPGGGSWDVQAIFDGGALEMGHRVDSGNNDVCGVTAIMGEVFGTNHVPVEGMLGQGERDYIRKPVEVVAY